MGWINVCVMYPTVFPKSVSFYLTRTYSISMWCALRISALHLDVKREWKPFEISQNKKLAKWVSEWVSYSDLRIIDTLSKSLCTSWPLKASPLYFQFLPLLLYDLWVLLPLPFTSQTLMYLCTYWLFFFLTEDYWMLFHLSCFELNCWFTLFLIEEGLAIQISNNFVCILILFSFIVKSYSGFSDLIIFTAKKW